MSDGNKQTKKVSFDFGNINKFFNTIFSEYRREDKTNLWNHVGQNFLYGFIHVTLLLFVGSGVLALTGLGYLIFFMYLSKTLNRPKYVTSLGKFIVFPFAATAGAVTGKLLMILIGV